MTLCRQATKHYPNLFDHNKRRHVALPNQNEWKFDGDQKFPKVAQEFQYRVMIHIGIWKWNKGSNMPILSFQNRAVEMNSNMK